MDGLPVAQKSTQRILAFLAVFAFFCSSQRQTDTAMATDMRTESVRQDCPTAALTFGVIADVQYADRDVKYDRHFRRAPERLEAAIADLNRAGVEFVVDLGDVIDGDFSSFGKILDVYAGLRVPVYRVLGNHDYGVDAAQLANVPAVLGLEKRYYSFTQTNRRFIVLDGNEVSTYAHPRGSPAHAAAQDILDGMLREGRPNAKTWNGGMSEAQLDWLRGTLARAADHREDVIILSHFPLWPPEDSLRLWNADDVVDIIDGFPIVKAVFAAHNHAGEHTVREGVHHVTFRAMVDTPDETAYAVVSVDNRQLVVRGAGRERSLTVEWQ